MGGDSRKKILIVEDNRMSKILIQEILTMNGYEVMEAENGAEALKVAGEKRPDLILMDINLPGMDGITAMRFIKAGMDKKDVPVLAFTASSMEGDDERLLKSGFDGCVSKPVDVKKLVETVKKYLDAE